MKKALHRIHASPPTVNHAVSFDLDGIRWRPDGAQDRKRARETASRLSLCWNLCEGWPTEALEAGVLRNVDEAARALIAIAEKSTTDTFPVDICAAIGKLRVALHNRDLHFDFTNGRANDCEGCSPQEDRDADTEEPR